jgi:hypothetical protein
MAVHQVAVFQQYPFEPGQKIHIADGPRKGDWEVVDADERSVTLRCPISGREFTWKRFCYLVEDREAEWPAGE